MVEFFLMQQSIKVGHALPVKHTLQGLDFKCMTQEPRLDTGILDSSPIFLPRQVDNFAVTAPNEVMANTLSAIMQEKYNSLLNSYIH